MKSEVLSLKKICDEWYISDVCDVIPFLTKEEVLNKLIDNKLPKKYPTRTKNSAIKIAWYLKNGWKKPLSLDLGCPSFRDCPWPIDSDSDNHKFAAAIIRGDKTIKADVSGQVNWIETFKV